MLKHEGRLQPLQNIDDDTLYRLEIATTAAYSQNEKSH